MISRTNVSVLLATLLLGILLWTVLGIVNEFGKIPEELPEPEPESTPLNLPLIDSRIQLENILSQHTTDVPERIEAYGDWLSSQGFPADYPLWASDDAEAGNAYTPRDNATLISLAGAGDIRAMYTLAERFTRDDPLESLLWYDQAIVTGSLYAMLKTADLLEMIADPELQDFFANPRWQAALLHLDAQDSPPLEDALAWSIAAVTAGGYAIVDQRHANRIVRLKAQLDESAVQRACNVAQQYLLDTAAAVRARGGMVFSIDQPPIALTVENPADVFQCDAPVRPLVDFDGCAAHPVQITGARKASLWICPYSSE